MKDNKEEIKISDFKDLTDDNFSVIGISNKSYSKVGTIFEADEASITWLNPTRKDKEELLKNTKAGLVICDNTMDVSSFTDKRTFVLVEDPRLIFTKILHKFFTRDNLFPTGVHPTAIIHHNAKIHPSVHIGPYCIIDECEIGEGSVIKSHVTIHNNVFIDKNVIIHEHSNVGGEGCGHIRNKEGKTERMPQVGRLIIESDVEMFQFVNIDKGTLSDTIVEKGVILDHYVHVGHNSKVGEYSIVAAKTVFCGGSSIGKKCFIGVQSIIIDAIKVGDNCTVGAGSVVTKHIPDNQTWTGAPAILLEDFKTLQKKIKNL